jgi:HAD superfamily hydrolase (TIGR01509 family)
MAESSPMGVGLIAFDCDGVLVDSERMELDVMTIALAWLDVTETADEILAVNRGGSFANLFAHIERLHGEPLPVDFGHRYRDLQLGMLEEVNAVPGAIEVINAIDLPRCVASGGPMEKMRTTLGATGLWDLFDPHIYSCYDIGAHKPAPDVYLHAAAQFGIAPSACVAIEDSANGAGAAAAAGMHVIGLARDVEPDPLMKAGAAQTVDELVEAIDLIAALM